VPAPLVVLRIPLSQSLRRPHPVLVQRRGLRGLGAAVQVLPAATVQTIASTIQQVEGYYPGSLSYSNNNPGNLIYAGQAGATRGAGGFAQFSTYQDGLDALNNQIQLYAGRGLTIQQMMNTYAPASAGNNPAAYANQVAGALGVGPDTALTDLSGAGAPVYSSLDLAAIGLPASLDPVWIGAAALVGVALYALS
jgi:hypothetical protein